MNSDPSPQIQGNARRLCLLVIALVATSFAARGAQVLTPGKDVPDFTGDTRSYAVTNEGDFAGKSFRAEITVVIASGHGPAGCAFFGLGKGTPNPGSFNEPTTLPSLAFRMAPNDFAGGQILATVNGEAAGETVLGDGTNRLRLSWDGAGKNAWLQIQRNWRAGIEFKPDALIYVPVVSATFGAEAHLFAGGSGGVKFSDFTVGDLSAAALADLPRSDVFRNDPSAGTWLPVQADGGGSDEAVKQLDAFLGTLNAALRPTICWYKDANLIAHRNIGSGSLDLPNSSWTSAFDIRRVSGEDDACDVKWTVSLTHGRSLSSGIAAAFDFTDWSTGNYVLIPASVYNGNRNRIVARGYAQGLDAGDYYRKDLPLTHGSVPCLAKESDKPSKFEVSACNAATPAVCIFDKKAQRGFILLTEQAGRGANGDYLRKPNGEIMDNAFAVEESADRSRATVVVSAPGVRSLKPEFIGFSGSPDRGMSITPGDAVTLKFRVYNFAAADIPAVLDKFMAVRKAVTGPNHPRLLMPASESEKMMDAKTDGRFLSSPKASFYCPENGPWIAFGWIGGWMDTFQMLALGDQTRLDRVTQTFDFGLKAQEPSGYFHYAINTDGNVAFREPRPDMNLSRCHGDILYWMLKQFILLRTQGRALAVKPEWENSMKRLADALVTTWKKDGQWGKMVNVKTGEVSEYNTTGGAMAIGGLALAGDYFRNAEYLAVAEQAARYYYDRDFVKQGQTTGACADILQNADSETAFAFTTSLATLYKITGETEWLQKARNLANLAATWTVSYDYELPKFTALGAIGTKFAGAVWASTQNKHAAPGACTNSGDSFFTIYRATGDTKYADLLRDIMRAHDDAFYNGGGTERLTYCDAELRGENPGGSNGWTETNGAMMSLENPGIYLRTDTGRFYVFDAVEAKILSRDASGTRMEITNPTKRDASISIFAENGAQAAIPCGFVPFVKWPKIPVNAGETTDVVISPDGKVR